MMLTPDLSDHRAVITASGRDFGRTLAICFAISQPRDCFIKAIHFEQV